MAELSQLDKEHLQKIMKDPALWSQAFLRTFNPETKKTGPWVPRWYQVEMLRDQSRRKVYRCGRRIGKTETMIVDMLHKACTNNNFRILVAAPFENQIRLIFMRINELVRDSPLLKDQITRSTKNPYIIEFENGSAILGFTTGDSAASIRGQRADWIYMDEIDFMSENCFDVVTSIAAERETIGITCSSTPTGKRSHFYKMCTDASMGYSQHYHPSMDNPNWGKKMDAEFRAQLTEQGYIHEVLAEFGTQEAGVFPKDKIDRAMNWENYAYEKLDFADKIKLEKGEITQPTMLHYDELDPAPFNPFRTVGVDWDKFGASSSILVLDYDVKWQKFKVIKRIEVPRGEYSYDNAIKMIIKVNKIYNPSWIFCDAGAGEYQIERLHIYGDSHPASGLRNKVVRCSFKENLDIMDPVTLTKTKKPLKQFMVNQLTISFERNKLILSPYDKVLYRQLCKYEVVKTTQDGDAVYSSKDEHFIDALGLAHLAFVLKFKELTNTIKDAEVKAEISFSNKAIGKAGVAQMFNEIQSSYTSMSSSNQIDPEGDGNHVIRQPIARTGFIDSMSRNWGSRSVYRSKSCGRSIW